MFKCFKTPRVIILLSAAVAIGAYLVIWQGEHVAVALPILVLLACPFMHFFMHGGHGRHRRHGRNTDNPSASPHQLHDKGE